MSTDPSRRSTGYTHARMRKCFQRAGVLMVNTIWHAPLLVLLAAASPVSAQQIFAGDDDRRFRVSLGMDYTSGSYGADEDTEILFMPLSFQAEQGPWTVRAVVPWLHVAGPVLVLDGGEGGAIGTREDDSASGMGDVSLSLMYSFEEFYQYNWFVDVTARVKIPTANLSDGLGTGEPDAYLQWDIAHALGQFIPFATLGYKWTGVPADFKLRNTVYGSLGLQYSWSNDVATGVSYDYRQSSFKESPDIQEGLAYMNIRFSDDWSVNIYTVLGFSQNSPDAGAGVAFVYRFP